MNEIKELLTSKIRSELEQLDDIELGSDTYKTAVDGIVKLTDKAIEITKVENDASDKEKSREFEQKKLEVNAEEKSKDRNIDETFKKAQLKDNKTDALLRNGVAIIGIVLPLGVTIWGTIKSLRFEQEGTVTTMVGRGFINKLIPKK